MSTFEQYLLSEGYDKLKEASKLSEEDSKNDPEEEPFRSKYKAREILTEVKDKLKRLTEENENEESRLLASVLDLKLGMNYIETEETHSGEEALNKCMDQIEKFKLDKKACNIYLTALNQCGILSCAQNNYPKALLKLEEAEKLYQQYKSENSGSPWSVEEYLIATADNSELCESRREASFENTHTLTLYYMAQIFAKSDESEKAAKYCQVTLQRQLESGQYDPIDWALNAATLSQYYITSDDFRMARHCLASATRIFQEAKSDTSVEEQLDCENSLLQRKADIDRCWIKYGLLLLESSRDRLYKEVENMDLNEGEKKQAKAEGNDSANDEMKEKMSIRFNLELTSIEEQIPCGEVNVFSEAREVFLRIQNWISSAKEFYSLEYHCPDCVELIQDHSRAFKVLAFFEMSLDRQCKMHKRRIDMLSAVLNELNPQHYLLVCRQLMYEVAETYSTMLDLKLAIAESEPEGSVPNSHAVQKMNSLAQQSINYYEKYIESLKGGKPELPEKFEEMDIRPALVAKFCMGRLFSKLISPELDQRLENMQKSLSCYKFLVDYCKRNPDHEKIVKNELAICVEMVELLPLKMQQARLNAAVN